MCLSQAEAENLKDTTDSPFGKHRLKPVDHFLALFKSPSGGGLTKMGSVTF